MSAFIVIPLLSCVVCAVLAAVLHTRDPEQPANRLAAALMGCTALWAFLEVLMHQSRDPAEVLVLARLTSLGWAPLGAIALHLFLTLSNASWPRLRRVVPAAYGLGGLAVLAECLTPWMHAGVEPGPAGTWRFVFGPAFGPFFLLMAGCVLAGFWVGWSSLRAGASEAERRQGQWISLAVLVPLLVAGATDAVMPMLGHPLPRLGTASLAFLGGVTLWSFRRYGYFLLAPGTFAHEILATLPEGVALLHADGRVRSVNARMAAMLQCAPESLAGLRLAERLDAPLPGLVEAERDCELQRPGADPLPVAVRARPLHDRQGLEIGTVVVVRDLTEVVALRSRLLLSGRLAAVGELAAGIAHEINNPLAFVRANLAMLGQHWRGLAEELSKRGGVEGDAGILLVEGEELLEESQEGVDRAVAIVRDIRGLAHAGGRERQVADLNTLLEGVLRIAGPQLRGRVECDLPEPCPVSCAPQELQQVFLNLVLNAAQAIADDGRIRVRTRLENEFVVASIEDDGCGIEPGIRDRIFDPFFTTKRVGEGTGLGLGIAYGIVSQHGGDVFLDSEPGRGTCFRVQLPAATDTLPDS